MHIHGTILDNLQSAITSATRLRGKPVYPDTLPHWSEILKEARRARIGTDERDLASLDALIAQLDSEICSFQSSLTSGS